MKTLQKFILIFLALICGQRLPAGVFGGSVPQATDAEVTAGTVRNKYVNPYQVKTQLNGKQPLATGTPTGSKFLRDDNSWQTISGGGDALVANPLSQFSATTSAQLRGVLSDETGTGIAYFVGGALGTPASGVATNLTGTAASLTAGTVTTNANLTGHITSTGNAAVLGSFTFTQLNTALTGDDAAGIGTANSWGDGIKQTFNPNGTSAGINVGSQAGDPSTPANGDIWYDSTANTLDARINGATVNLGSGGGSGTITAGATNVIPKYTGSTTVDDSLLSDNGTTLTYTGTGGLSLASGSTAGALVLTQGTTQSTGTTNITLQAPTGVTSYIRTLPGAVGSTGLVMETVSGSVQTESIVTALPANFTVTAPTSAATDMAGYMGMPQNSQSAAYTIVRADAGKHILHPTADNNARTITIDSNANLPYPIGTVITVVNQINTVTIAITSDTLTWYAGSGTGSTGSRSLAAGGVATLLKITATSWIISGPGVS